MTEPDPQGQSFALAPEPPLPANLRGYFREKYSFYAQFYGYHPEGGRRTIKRFVADGRAAVPPDLPPLDEPAKMPAWYRRHHPSRQVPAGIRHAAAQASAVAVAVEAVPPPVVVPPPAAGMDFPAQVAELRIVVSSHLDTLRAIGNEACPPSVIDPTEQREWATGKSDRLDAAQRNYKSSLEILRKAETDLIEWQKAHGDLAPRAEIAMDMTRMMTAIHVATRRLLKVVRPLLVGKSEAEQEKIWEEKHRECFRILKSSKFATEADVESIAA